MPIEIKLQLVPARRGTAWLRGGFVVFRLKPLAFAAMFMSFSGFALIALQLPYVGGLLLLMALPLISLGFMLATKHTLEGKMPTPELFIAPLRTDRQRRVALLQMGFLYVCCSLAVMALSNWVDSGKFDALQEALLGGQHNADALEPLLADPQLQFGMLFRLGLAGLLSLPFWHAPALVHWGQQTVGKTLFFSAFACWRNRGALIVYCLAWATVALFVALVSNFLAFLLPQPELIAIMVSATALMLTTIFYASLYFTFADNFGMTPDVPEPAAETPL